MTEPQIGAYVDDLAGRVPHVEVPLVAVLAAGRAATRRRRRRRGGALLAVSAAVVAAVTIGPSLVVQQGEPDVLHAGESAPVAAPEGMKLIGTQGVAIAVPNTWTYDAGTECGYRAETYVVRLTGPRCGLVKVPEVSHVRFATDDSGRPTPGRTSTVTLGSGERVTRTTDRAASSTIVFWTFQARDLVVEATVLGSGASDVIDRMQEGLQVLPDGWTTSLDDAAVVRGLSDDDTGSR